MSDPAALSRELLASSRADPGGSEGLAARLDSVDPAAIEGDRARIAFWLNLYNACVIAELGLRPRAGSLLRHRRLFDRAGYTVGGLRFSPNVIEHGVLRLNARPPFALRRVLRRSDPRLAAQPARLDPRVHFALNCGAVSCPPIRAYEPHTLDHELAAATATYVAAETTIDRDRGRVRLPYLLRLYRADFGDRRQVLELVARQLPPADGEWLLAGGPRISYARFDWTIA